MRVSRNPTFMSAWPPSSWLDGNGALDKLCSIKYEEVCLHVYETVSVAREGIGRYINVYNTRRPHSTHQARTPDVVCFASLHQPSADAA